MATKMTRSSKTRKTPVATRVAKTAKAVTAKARPKAKAVAKSKTKSPDAVLPSSSDAVLKATGRSWDEWFSLLDAAGAQDWSHKEIVAWIAREHPRVVSAWWQQSITVTYEKARGKRVLGETEDVGFQVGVRRTIAASAEDVWRLITSRPELWLGDGASVEFTKGATYEVPKSPGSMPATGEVRVVKPLDRLRMTWHPQGWKAPATLQLTVTRTAPRKTSLGAHMEKLPGPDARAEMKEHWRETLERIAEELES